MSHSLDYPRNPLDNSQEGRWWSAEEHRLPGCSLCEQVSPQGLLSAWWHHVLNEGQLVHKSIGTDLSMPIWAGASFSTDKTNHTQFCVWLSPWFVVIRNLMRTSLETRRTEWGAKLHFCNPVAVGHAVKRRGNPDAPSGSGVMFGKQTKWSTSGSSPQENQDTGLWIRVRLVCRTDRHMPGTHPRRQLILTQISACASAAQDQWRNLMSGKKQMTQF